MSQAIPEVLLSKSDARTRRTPKASRNRTEFRDCVLKTQDAALQASVSVRKTYVPTTETAASPNFPVLSCGFRADRRQRSPAFGVCKFS